MNDFETVDWITYVVLVATLAAWFVVTAIAFSPGIVEFLWLSILPAILLSVFASRRWSTALSKGPAAPFGKHD